MQPCSLDHAGSWTVAYLVCSVKTYACADLHYGSFSINRQVAGLISASVGTLLTVVVKDTQLPSSYSDSILGYTTTKNPRWNAYPRSFIL